MIVDCDKHPGHRSAELRTSCIPCVEIFHVGKNVWLNAIDLHCHSGPRETRSLAGINAIGAIHAVSEGNNPPYLGDVSRTLITILAELARPTSRSVR